jgi:hypothetical protein
MAPFNHSIQFLCRIAHPAKDILNGIADGAFILVCGLSGRLSERRHP